MREEVTDGWFITEPIPEWAEWVSHLHGHDIFSRDGEEWFYSDGSEASQERPCPRCGRPATPEGHDACLGHLDGAVSACCGHGVEEPYVVRGKRIDIQ